MNGCGAQLAFIKVWKLNSGHHLRRWRDEKIASAVPRLFLSFFSTRTATRTIRVVRITSDSNAMSCALCDYDLSTREVLIGHEEMLILAGRIGRNGTEAEVVQALD